MKKVRSVVGIGYNKLYYALYPPLPDNTEKLTQFKDKYKGKRCFLIGSGPSLKKTDLSLIKDEIKIGMNRLYMSNISTDLYFIIAPGMMGEYEDFLPIDNLFLGGRAARIYLKHRDWMNNGRYEEPYIIKEFGEISVWKDISLDITKGLRGGLGVTFVALQTLLYMGFKEVYLIGHDCDYQSEGQFFYDKSDIGYDREWGTIFNNYKIIKQWYEEEGSVIYNATVGGKLEVFERKQLSEI